MQKIQFMGKKLVHHIICDVDNRPFSDIIDQNLVQCNIRGGYVTVLLENILQIIFPNPSSSSKFSSFSPCLIFGYHFCRNSSELHSMSVPTPPQTMRSKKLDKLSLTSRSTSNPILL
mmetsp:Transcript_14256/g.18687  ORF Transcript_14256/g.18687 Transcript_14256/m.18687 type:complete len:117 (+) Transcript_14256:190-540(+)